MNAVLWVLQVLLAIAFAMAGMMKLVRSKEQLAASMGWVEDFSSNAIKGIGGLEVMGALGLVLPAATGIVAVLTPLAAGGLVLLTAGATITHLRRHEYPMIAMPGMLAILALVVAWGRFGPWPL